MTKYKVEKNPESPGGRKDWEGRSPRRRLNFLHSQLAILNEWSDDYFKRHPEKLMDKTYLDLQERIAKALQDIQKPLLTEIEVSLWDQLDE
jgi:hypothetical protein